MRPFPVFLALLIPLCASAEVPLPLRGGDPVTILRKDGSRAEARYMGQAEDPPRLLLGDPKSRRLSGWKDEVRLDDISRLEAKGATEFREVRVLRGMLIGMVAGGVLGFVLHDVTEGSHGEPFYDSFGSHEDDRIANTVHGMQFGSGVGALVGLLTAGTSGPSRSWTFDELGRPVPAAP